MRKLIVDTPGLTIKIPGLPPTQTPAEINIDKVDLNLVVSYLRQYGLPRYKIIEVPENKVKQKKIEEKPESTKKEAKKSDVDMKKLMGEFNDIKSLLKELIEKEPSVVKVIESKGYSAEELKKPIVEDEDAFIPMIDTEDFEVKGSTVRTKETEDVSDNIDALKKILEGEK